MKCPINITGRKRKNRSDWLVKGGILAQQCEDACEEIFHPGTEEYEDCVAECEEES